MLEDVPRLLPPKIPGKNLSRFLVDPTLGAKLDGSGFGIVPGLQGEGGSRSERTGAITMVNDTHHA